MVFGSDWARGGGRGDQWETPPLLRKFRAFRAQQFPLSTLLVHVRAHGKGGVRGIALRSKWARGGGRGVQW